MLCTAEPYDLKSIIFLLLISIIFKTLEPIYLDVSFLHAFVAVFTFLLALNLPCERLSKCSKQLRKLSTAIYLEHFIIILIFDFYLKKGTLIDFIFTLSLSILIYAIAQKLLPKKINNLLFNA